MNDRIKELTIGIYTELNVITSLMKETILNEDALKLNRKDRALIKILEKINIFTKSSNIKLELPEELKFQISSELINPNCTFDEKKVMLGLVKKLKEKMVMAIKKMINFRDLDDIQCSLKYIVLLIQKVLEKNREFEKKVRGEVKEPIEIKIF